MRLAAYRASAITDREGDADWMDAVRRKRQGKKQIGMSKVIGVCTHIAVVSSQAESVVASHQ